MKAPASALFLLCFTLSIQTGEALITGGKGNEPMKNRGWPTGSEAVANLGTRIAWWEGPPYGGGQYTFEYQARSTADFNEALAAFAKIAVPKRELILRNGPIESFWMRDAKPEEKVLDWTFVVWRPENWNHLYNNPKTTFSADHPSFRQPVDPPRIVAYLGEGKIDWDEVKVPEGVTVIDQRGTPGEEASITGAVYDMETGQAIKGATVRAVRNRAVEGETLPEDTTDASGRFALTGLPEGVFVAVVSHDGYARKRGLHNEMFRKSDTREVKFELAKAAALAGVVRNPNGEPIADARVIAKDVIGKDGRGYSGVERLEVKTDAEGEFSIEGLPIGFARLTVWAEGWHNPTSVTAVYATPSEDPVVISMIGTGTVKGTLKMIGKRKRQANVSIREAAGEEIGSWGGSMRCKPDGSFEFKNVPEGEYLVGPSRGLSPNESDPAVQAITVKAGEVVTVEIVEE